GGDVGDGEDSELHGRLLEVRRGHPGGRCRGPARARREDAATLNYLGGGGKPDVTPVALAGRIAAESEPSSVPTPSPLRPERRRALARGRDVDLRPYGAS